MSVLHVNFIYGVENRYQTNSQKKKKKKTSVWNWIFSKFSLRHLSWKKKKKKKKKKTVPKAKTCSPWTFCYSLHLVFM